MTAKAAETNAQMNRSEKPPVEPPRRQNAAATPKSQTEASGLARTRAAPMSHRSAARRPTAPPADMSSPLGPPDVSPKLVARPPPTATPQDWIPKISMSTSAMMSVAILMGYLIDP
jgi:hypothetical protein